MMRGGTRRSEGWYVRNVQAIEATRKLGVDVMGVNVQRVSEREREHAKEEEEEEEEGALGEEEDKEEKRKEREKRERKEGVESFVL
jgi:hypothetical protein